MLLRPFLYDPTACASYRFGCGTRTASSPSSTRTRSWSRTIWRRLRRSRCSRGRAFRPARAGGRAARGGWDHFLERFAVRAAGRDPGPDPWAQTRLDVLKHELDWEPARRQPASPAPRGSVPGEGCSSRRYCSRLRPAVEPQREVRPPSLRKSRSASVGAVRPHAPRRLRPRGSGLAAGADRLAWRGTGGNSPGRVRPPERAQSLGRAPRRSRWRG